MEEFDVFDNLGNYIGRAVPRGSGDGEGCFVAIAAIAIVFLAVVFLAPIWIGMQIMKNGGWENTSSRTKMIFVLSFLPWVLVAMQGIVDNLEHSNVCARTEIQIHANEILVKSKYDGPMNVFLSVNGGEEENHLINMGRSYLTGSTFVYDEPVREVKLLRVFGYLGSPNKYFSENCTRAFYP